MPSIPTVNQLLDKMVLLILILAPLSLPLLEFGYSLQLHINYLPLWKLCRWSGRL